MCNVGFSPRKFIHDIRPVLEKKCYYSCSTCCSSFLLLFFMYVIYLIPTTSSHVSLSGGYCTYINFTPRTRLGLTFHYRIKFWLTLLILIHLLVPTELIPCFLSGPSNYQDWKRTRSTLCKLTMSKLYVQVTFLIYLFLHDLHPFMCRYLLRPSSIVLKSDDVAPSNSLSSSENWMVYLPISLPNCQPDIECMYINAIFTATWWHAIAYANLFRSW